MVLWQSIYEALGSTPSTNKQTNWIRNMKILKQTSIKCNYHNSKNKWDNKALKASQMKNEYAAGGQWLTPVIIVTQEGGRSQDDCCEKAA
jgi:hypothetical protein